MYKRQELDPAHLRTVLGAVREELDALIRSYDAGAVLREGVDCAIVGLSLIHIFLNCKNF